jgi:tripartite-type tricarboxylate transporter receptor subunit TctC
MQIGLGVLMALVMLTLAQGHAQEYPGAKPIRILTSQPGSGSDIVARILADRLPASFGQRAIVDNRGILAPEIAAKAPPDGYTVLFYSTPLWVSPLMRENVAWDPVRDFAPVALAVNAPNILVVHPSLPVKSVKELIALAKTKPGELNYGSGSSGSSSHLAAELFNSMANLNVVRVPYRGVGPALLGLLGGHVQVMFPSASSVLPYMNTGKARALAVASAKPSALVPGLPTIASAGLPGYEADTPLGVFVPAGTPPRVIERLNRGLVAILNITDVKKLVTAQGSEVVASSPAEFAATLKTEIARWSKLIKVRGLREE